MINNSDYYEIYLIDSTTGSTGNYAKLDCEGIDMSTTFQVADVADISSRKDAITKTISFKATKNNNIIFGNLSNLNRYVDPNINLSFFFNFDITQDIPCVVYENMVQIFQGTLHFLSANRDNLGNITYECAIKGYTADFFYLINDKLISDLNFSAFTHTYNIDNIVNSWSNVYVKNGLTVSGSTGEGYVYPQIDYGCSITDDPAFDNYFDYRNYRPAFYLNEYFNALFTQTGLTGNYSYTVTGNTSFMDEWSKIIVPNNDSDFSYSQAPEIIFELQRAGVATSYNGNNQTFYDSVNHRTEYYNIIGFTSTLTGHTGQTIIDPNVEDGKIIHFLNTINTTVTASMTFICSQAQGTNATIRFRALYRALDTDPFVNIGETVTEYVTYNERGILVNPAKTVKLTLTNTFVAGGELALVLYIDAHTPGDVAVNFNTADIQIGSILSASQVTISLGNEAVLVGQNTQNLKQVDFLKSVIQTFNLYVYPNAENPKNIIFTPYNDYYNNFTAANIRNTAIDWTKKIDNGATFQITPATDLFNLYTFNFKDDTDFYSKYYKDRWGITYGNLTLTGTTNGQNQSIDLIFGSTPVAYYNGKSVPYLWTLDTDNLKKQQVTVPRLLFYNGLYSCPTYQVGEISLSATTSTYYFQSLSGDTSAHTFSQYPQANEYSLSVDGEFCDLTFGQPYEVYYTAGGVLTNYGSGKKNLYDRYYSQQITELTDKNTRIITVSAYLNEIDIQNLDFRTPVYFNSVLGNNYFKVLKVEYSNNQSPSTITLQTAYIYDSGTPFVGFENAALATNIQKDDCDSTLGFVGETIFYFVPGGRYMSDYSQAEADAMATNEVITSGQTFANTHGVCIYTGNTFLLGFASTPTDAEEVTPRTVYVTDTGILNIGSIIFEYNNGSPIRWIGGYYANDTNWYLTNYQSVIGSSGTTESLSGATYDVYFVYSSYSEAVACTLANSSGSFINYKINRPFPAFRTIVTTPSGDSVPDGFYSDGTSSYNVVGGFIMTIYSCSISGGIR